MGTVQCLLDHAKIELLRNVTERTHQTFKPPSCVCTVARSLCLPPRLVVEHRLKKEVHQAERPEARYLEVHQADWAVAHYLEVHSVGEHHYQNQLVDHLHQS
ncbi:hypothetical protein PsorP6_000885 [Peronosclerospora sorghi]|uniref:Uncharacterized protein n=1 Tax=Peronosclerospora sorghi TaxID=230839 RepID=A0ACC0WT47_9STRA|nr:hypothetical protein PsorP6_000885 [Peronosclerospora sorghi]